MPQSIQEEVIHAAMKASMGAPYLFQPDNYKKGAASREPADLAWVCRKTLFLFNLKSGKKSASHQARKNLDQLGGFLRVWTPEMALTGANEWQKFSIDRSSIEKICLISVCNGPGAFAGIDRGFDRTRFSDVAVAAVIPESLLMCLVQWGGTAVDLADFLLQLTTLREVPEDLATALLAEQHACAVQ